MKVWYFKWVREYAQGVFCCDRIECALTRFLLAVVVDDFVVVVDDAGRGGAGGGGWVVVVERILCAYRLNGSTSSCVPVVPHIRSNNQRHSIYAARHHHHDHHHDAISLAPCKIGHYDVVI